MVGSNSRARVVFAFDVPVDRAKDQPTG